jgi:hypothetical protein
VSTSHGPYPLPAALILTFPLSCSISLLTASLYDGTGWSSLPLPSRRVGTSIKLRRCAGCLRGFTKAHPPDLPCAFSHRGFPLEAGGSVGALACGSIYHATCFFAGPPFLTRLKDNKGLCFPRRADPSLFPNFVCEACQVRSILGRELRYVAKDVHLLTLERMRILDTMNRLAEGSHKTYKSPILRIQRFESLYQVRILRPTFLDAPSRSACIPLMWAQLAHTLQPGRAEGSRVKFSSARQSRSAVSAFYMWDLAMSRPEQAIAAGQGSHVALHVLPTEELCYTHFSAGLRRRMGDSSKKSAAPPVPTHPFPEHPVRNHVPGGSECGYQPRGGGSWHS